MIKSLPNRTFQVCDRLRCFVVCWAFVSSPNFGIAAKTILQTSIKKNIYGQDYWQLLFSLSHSKITELKCKCA